MDKNELLNILYDYGADVEGVSKRFCGNFELYEKCLYGFFNEKNIILLDEIVQKGEFEQAFAPAHTLKGLSGNLGLTPLYNTISDLVGALRNREHDSVCEKYADVAIQISELKTLFDNI